MAHLARNFSIPFTQSRVTYGRLLQAMYSNVFNILKAAKSTLLSGKSDPVFDHHHRNKNVLHNSKWKCNLCLFLLVLSLGTTEKGMTSSSFFLPSLGSYRLIRFPQSFPFSKINPLSSPSLSWYR